MTRKPQFCRRYMRALEEVYPLLADKKRIVLTTHQKPDGDAMGAALALYHFLSVQQHEAIVISPTNWAGFLNWMPGCDKVMNFETETEKSTEIINNAEILFCVDFNMMHRTKRMEQVLTNFNGIKVLIDHHREPPEGVFNYGRSDIEKSSTCEMVYDFIAQSPDADKLNLDMAACLYTGIMTDTGSFRFAVTSAKVHRIVANLKDLGLNHAAIHDKIYDNLSENRLRFVGNALLNRLEVLYEYNTAFMAISKRDLLKYDIKTGDTEGLVNYLLTIEGIKLGALVIDRTEERKWSFRSKENFDVNSLARAHFEGGGHFNAAGGRSTESLDDTIKKFKEVLKIYENQLQ